MKAVFSLVRLGGLAAACSVVCLVASAGEKRPPGAALRGISFQSPPLKENFYPGGHYTSGFNDGGRCSISAKFVRTGSEIEMSWGGNFELGDVVAVLGGVFLADRVGNEFAYFARVADKDLPKGVKEPAWDSLAVPQTGYGMFWPVAMFKAPKILGTDDRDASAELELTLYPSEK